MTAAKASVACASTVPSRWRSVWRSGWRRWTVGAQLLGYVDLRGVELGGENLSVLESLLFYNDALADTDRVGTKALLRADLDAHSAAWLAGDDSPGAEFVDHERRARELAALDEPQRRERDDQGFAAVLAEADTAAALIRALATGAPAPRTAACDT